MLIRYINKNYSNIFTVLPILFYLYYFDQSFQVFSVIIDLRASIVIIFLLLFISRKIDEYKFFLRNIIFLSIFIFIQSYLLVNVNDFDFSNKHYFKIIMIIFFLSILITYSNLIYTKIYKIIYLFIITFPLVYLCSRLYCFLILFESFDIFEFIKFINLKFGDLRILLINSEKYYNAPILFKEQSHFSMVATFTIFLLLKLIQKIKFNKILYISSVFYLWIIYLNYSSTMLYGYAFSLILLFISDFKNIKKYSIFYTILSIILIIFLFFVDDKIKIQSKDLSNFFLKDTNRYFITLNNYNETNELNSLNKKEYSNYKSIEIRNLSSEVYLFNLKISLIALKNKITGYGINSFSNVHEKYKTQVPNKLQGSNWLNRSNGSNIFVKSLAEFGIISLFIGFLFMYIILFGGISHQKKVFIISGLVTIVLIRGAGYVSAGFLLFFAILIHEFIKVVKHNFLK